MRPVHWWMIDTLVTLLVLPFLYWAAEHVVRVLIAFIPRTEEEESG